MRRLLLLLLLSWMVAGVGSACGLAVAKVSEGLPVQHLDDSLDVVALATPGTEPLILVHGIGPDKGPNNNWDHFLRFATAQTAFSKRFKVYLFHYNPASAIDAVVPRFQAAAKTVLHHSGQSRFSVVALSQGGLIVRRGYQDPALAQAARRTLMVGSPLHGTPLANPRWIQRSHNPLNPAKLGLGLVYHGTQQKLPHFEQDFCWDNVDNGLDETVNGGKPSGCRKTDRPTWPTPRIVTYGGFFGNTPAQQRFLLGMLQSARPALPKEQASGLLSRDKLFDLTQKKIAGVKLANAPCFEYRDAEFYPMMVYNDGVTPLASALWLGRFGSDPKPGTELEGTVLGQMSLWQALKALQGTGTARVFAGVDHQGWMLNAPRTQAAEVDDLLNPAEPSRTLFQWMVDDLTRD